MQSEPSVNETVFVDAKDVAELIGISKSKAYQIIRDLNKELAADGFITIGGKIARHYLEERMHI